MKPDTPDRRSFLGSAGAAAAIVGCSSLLGDRYAAAQQRDELANHLYYIIPDGSSTILKVLDGEVWFTKLPRSPNDTSQKYKQALTAFKQELTVKCETSSWRYNNNHIRVKIPQDTKGLTSAQLRVNGHYLSADYSTIPPRVNLTPEPNEWSRWELEAVDGRKPSSYDPFIGVNTVRNLNARESNAWLAIAETEYFRDPVRLWSVSKPILSFDEKLRFYWGSYRSDDTSK